MKNHVPTPAICYINFYIFHIWSCKLCTKYREGNQCEVQSLDATTSPSVTTSGLKWRKSMQETCTSPWVESACSRWSCDTLLGVVESVVQVCSERVHEDVPFRDNLVCMSGLPVQLYRDVTASERDSDGSVDTRTHGHQKKNWAKPRRNLR